MTDGERIIKLETQMDNIEQKVDAGFRASEKRHEDLTKMLSDFIEKSDRRFASKWVEKAVWGASAVMGTGLLIAILANVIHH